MASILEYTGLSPQPLEFQEGASAGSFVANDLVQTDTAGQLEIAAAAKILGIADSAATGTQATKINVRLINPNEIYVIAYKASATALSLVGKRGDIVYTAGAHTFDDASTASNELTVVGLHPGDAVGTSGGRLLVRFNPDKFTQR